MSAHKEKIAVDTLIGDLEAAAVWFSRENCEASRAAVKRAKDNIYKRILGRVP
jgi:hypothetical protein